MEYRPILCSGLMVRNIINGTQTQDRRIIKPHLVGESRHPPHGPVLWVHEDYHVPIDSADALAACPFGQPGDRLWVRETWTDGHSYDGKRHFAYKADGEVSGAYQWKRSTHMPRAASRLTLEVTGVRIEPLNDITRGDAMAEGCPYPNMKDGPSPRDWYRYLWEEINGDGSWAANPWVWVVEFRRVDK